MSHNRKNIGRQFRTTATPQEQNRRFTYLIALVAAAGLLIGLVLSSAPARANSGPDPIEQAFAQLYQTIDNLKSKVAYVQKDRDRANRYADCLKRHNRYLEQVLDGEKNYYAVPVCKR